MIVVSLFTLRQAREKGRSLEDAVEQLQDDLLRAQRAVKSAEMLQVLPFSNNCAWYHLSTVRMYPCFKNFPNTLSVSPLLAFTGGRHDARPNKTFVGLPEYTHRLVTKPRPAEGIDHRPSFLEPAPRNIGRCVTRFSMHAGLGRGQQQPCQPRSDRGEGGQGEGMPEGRRGRSSGNAEEDSLGFTWKESGSCCRRCQSKLRLRDPPLPRKDTGCCSSVPSAHLYIPD